MSLQLDPSGRGSQILLAQTQRGLGLMAHQVDTGEAVAELKPKRCDRIEVGAGLQTQQQGRVGFRLGQEGFELGIGHGMEGEDQVVAES